MRGLIPIHKKNGEIAVNARDLCAYLDVRRDFSNWIKSRIEKFGFQEGEDFTPILAKTPQGRPLKEYALTIDMAKELAMVENNDKGKQARRYFIEVEKNAKQALSPAEFLVQQAQMLLEQERRVNALEERVEIVEAKSVTRPDYFTVAGFANLSGINIGLKLASKLGRAASRICKDAGYSVESIPDPRFGKVGMYPKTVLERVFNEDL